MTEARLIRSVTVGSTNKGIRIGSTTYSLTEGVYYHSDDGTASDLIEAIEDVLQTALGGSTLTVHIIGVGVAASPTLASGRVQFVHSSGATQVIDWDHAGTTINPAWLGYDEAVTGTLSIAVGTTNSPYVHRYGWYPQTDAEEDVTPRTLRNHVAFTSGGYRSGIPWGEDQRINLAWDMRPCALVEIDQAKIATRAADVKTTQHDPHIAFERWALDCAAEAAADWRFYPDASDTATYHGPFTFSDQSVLWTQPLAAPTGIVQRAGRYWAVVVDGQQARS